MGAIGYVWGLDGFWLGGVVDIRVLSLCAGLDCEELVKGQDARFAAAIALLALVEDGDASCWCVSGGVCVGLLGVGRLDGRW